MTGKNDTKKNGKVLVIDDDPDVLNAVRLLLKKHVEAVTIEKDPEKIPDLLRDVGFDVVFLDMNFARGATSGKEGFKWLKKILTIDPNVVVILITAYGDVESAVRAIKEGAMDFILKPWRPEKLLATLSAALNLRTSRKEAETLRTQQKQLSDDLDKPFHEFIGESAPMQEVFRSINKVAGTDANVLILGENGTGKELVARAIHRQSFRSGEVFISVDIGAISETLFESELFGHKKGAFTDAREDRAGRFEVANGGTLFLDEIGNLPMTLQAKMLRAIETRAITRLGSNQPVTVDVRLICATNQPIYEMVAENRFRQDLLYRINTVEIRIPPLRERPDDIPPLVEHFMKEYCRKYNKPLKKLSSAAMQKLKNYAWPGNVRELQHALERAVIMSESRELDPQDFFLTQNETAPDKSGGSYNLEEVEKNIIRNAISKHGGNISQAARELGLSRASLYRRLEKYGL
jgi:DNA-binding NtrC family response regulator